MMQVLHLIEKPFLSCPSDNGPILNLERAVSIALPDFPGGEINPIVSARGSYVAVNSVHSAPCLVQERRAWPLDTVPFGNDGVFSRLNQHVLHKEVSDGHSQTLLFGERAWKYKRGGVTYDSFGANIFLNRFAKEIVTQNGQGSGDTCATLNGGEAINFAHANPLKAMDTFSSRHPGGAVFAMCDGSVKLFRETTDPSTLVRLGNKSDGQPVPELE